jgi:hypothetical protein
MQQRLSLRLFAAFPSEVSGNTEPKGSWGMGSTEKRAVERRKGKI